MFQFANRARVLAGVALVISVSTAAEATVFVEWGTVSNAIGGHTANGTLGGVSVNVFNNSAYIDGIISRTTDLSDTSVFAQAGAASQGVLQCNNDGAGAPASFTSTNFGSTVENLGLYFRFWRGGGYRLVALGDNKQSVSYSFLSGNYAAAPIVTNSTFELSANFTSGIIQFHGAVRTVFWEVTNPAVDGGTALTTFAILDPVPAPGAVALLGLAGLAGRRRR